MKKGVYDGYLTLLEGTRKINLPFLYVKDEPNYPRVMGFEFEQGDREGTYRYEMYLPRGADEFGIALYHADSLAFAGFMDWGKPAPRGLIKRELTSEELPQLDCIRRLFSQKERGEK